ncbi:MAG: hypothetical protein NTV07_07290 [Candidatus Omnitrophica bacterium]|nr:hypothetical protein [Candidatus Omnitrophota bacterium]
MKTVLLALAVSLTFAHPSFSEEPASAKEVAEKTPVVDVDYLSNAVSKAYEKAILHIDAQKELKKAKDDEEITAKLNSVIDEWQRVREAYRQGQINATINQEWEKTITSLPYHMDYYLRDQNKEIKESDSVTDPYVADVLIKETLYVEQGPLIAEPRVDYRYVALIGINLKLSYDKSADTWQISDANEGIAGLQKGWPEEVAKKAGMYFIPQEGKYIENFEPEGYNQVKQ